MSKPYFYADSDAVLYDQTIGCVVAHYDLLHNTLVQLCQQAFRDITESVLLDLGSGTGMEALSLLKSCPNSRIVAIDHSREMHNHFRKRILRELGEAGLDRVHQVCVDLSSDVVSDAGLESFIPKKWGIDAFNGVVSAFTLHHFDRDLQLRIWRLLVRSLTDGGVFINLDLFTFVNTFMSKLALDTELDWIDRSFREKANRLKQQDVDSSTLERLRREWKTHYLNDNQTRPIDSSISDVGIKEDLISAGFKSVECPFRIWQTAILWSRL